jgi:HK97 family phage prohead protease
MTVVRRDFNAPLQLLADRGVAGVVSSSALDAFGEVIDPKGVRWRDGVKLLWSHDPRQPIGRAERIAVEGDKVVANFRLASPGVDPTADRAHALVKDGIVDSFSVGGIAHRWQGNTVTDFEIVEVSLVSVPANPDAQVTSIRSATDYMPPEADLGRSHGASARTIGAPAIRGEPRQWSFGRALALLDGVPAAQIDWGLEREISDELSKAVPTDRPGGIRMPFSVLLRAIGTTPGDVARAFNVPLMVLGEITANRANSVEATRLFVSMCLETMASRVGDAVGLFVLTPAERSAALRVVINLRRLTRGFGVELADAQSKEVLAGIKSRNEARAEQGLAGSADTAPFLVPVNMETTEQAQQRSNRANAESAANGRPQRHSCDSSGCRCRPGDSFPRRRAAARR